MQAGVVADGAEHGALRQLNDDVAPTLRELAPALWSSPVPETDEGRYAVDDADDEDCKRIFPSQPAAFGGKAEARLRRPGRRLRAFLRLFQPLLRKERHPLPGAPYHESRRGQRQQIGQIRQVLTSANSISPHIIHVFSILVIRQSTAQNKSA